MLCNYYLLHPQDRWVQRGKVLKRPIQDIPGMAVETEFYRTVLADLKWCEEKAGSLPDPLLAE